MLPNFAEILLDFAKMLAKICRNFPRIGRGIKIGQHYSKLVVKLLKISQTVRSLDRTG